MRTLYVLGWCPRRLATVLVFMCTILCSRHVHARKSIEIQLAAASRRRPREGEYGRTRSRHIDKVNSMRFDEAAGLIRCPAIKHTRSHALTVLTTSFKMAALSGFVLVMSRLLICRNSPSCSIYSFSCSRRRFSLLHLLICDWGCVTTDWPMEGRFG